MRRECYWFRLRWVWAHLPYRLRVLTYDWFRCGRVITTYDEFCPCHQHHAHYDEVTR